MKVFRLVIPLLLFSLVLSTCDLISSDSDKKFYLSTTASPDEGGVVTPAGGSYVEGEMITLQAEANEGWIFLHWDGDITLKANPLNLAVDRNLIVIGVFERKNIALPTVRTESIEFTSRTTVVASGTVIRSGLHDVIDFGVCYSTNPDPDIHDTCESAGQGVGSFSVELMDLEDETTYFLRAYASNQAGTSYGNEIEFDIVAHYHFEPGEGVTDVDGNSYETVVIGYQEWMAENLRVTRYRNRDHIPQVIDNHEWENTYTGAWSWYENDESYEDPYGKLYNWYAVDDYRGLCPVGWKVPGDAQWDILIHYLEGNSGGKLKETGTEHWYPPNTGATNETGFSALPGGERNRFGDFNYVRFLGYYWSSQNLSFGMSSRRRFYHDSDHVSRWELNKRNGYSVRCIKE